MENSYSADANMGKYIMPIESYTFQPILYTQISTSAYLLADANTGSNPKKDDITFNSNKSIWDKIISGNIRRTDSKIVLNNFHVFEWFPRSPGLFHTQDALYAREEARHRIISSENGFIAYNPYGKLSMLEGGFGNIRLNPIKLETGLYYFMTASDNGVCHEGFPIALPEHLYNEVIDEINGRGSVVKDIFGVLRNVPQDIDELYRDYRRVPKVYLQVEELRNSKYPEKTSPGNLSVTVATSFISSYEAQPRIYASYVGFNPSQKRQLNENVEWMENKYVKGMYKGKILTDFDQTTNHFDYAPFSLKKIMNLEVKAEDINAVATQIGINERDIMVIQNQLKLHLKGANRLTVPTIFISYNQQDIETAKKIQKRLQAEGFKVIRDEDNIQTGENISAFIKRSIQQSQFTLSIVSRNSLESAWVAMETIISGYGDLLLGRRFLPVHIDDDFFDIRFVSKTSDNIDLKINELNDLMIGELQKGRGIEDLQDDLSRLKKLKNNLPEIVGKLRNLKCTDLSSSVFDNGIRRLIDDIRSMGNEGA